MERSCLKLLNVPQQSVPCEVRAVLNNCLWTDSLLWGFPERLRCYKDSTIWLQKRLEKISCHVCYCLMFFQHLQFLPGHHCQLVNIHKCHFWQMLFKTLKNMKILGSLTMQEELLHSLMWEKALIHTQYNSGTSQKVRALESYWEGKFCADTILNSLKVLHERKKPWNPLPILLHLKFHRLEENTRGVTNTRFSN